MVRVVPDPRDDRIKAPTANVSKEMDLPKGTRVNAWKGDQGLLAGLTREATFGAEKMRRNRDGTPRGKIKKEGTRRTAGGCSRRVGFRASQHRIVSQHRLPAAHTKTC